MAIVAGDIVLRLSTTAGSAGDTTTGTAPGSLGKYVSTTVMPVTLNGLFDDVTGSENAASTVDYRCIFVLNNHATLTASAMTIYLASEVAGGTSIAIAIDGIAASAKGSASAQAAQIASETTAPTGVGAFSSPTTDGTGLSIGSLAPGQVKAVWVRRTAANSAPLSNDGVTLAVTFDTPA